MEEWVRVKKFTCDSCGAEQLVEKNEFPPFLGYNGTVEAHLGTGGSSGKWFACSDKCIPGAINTALWGNQ
jgi:hypothetical protein